MLCAPATIGSKRVSSETFVLETKRTPELSIYVYRRFHLSRVLFPSINTILNLQGYAMLHAFLSDNRDELTARCREKVRIRPGRGASAGQLKNGVPMFLDQLIRTLRVEETNNSTVSRSISWPEGGERTLSEVSVTTSQHATKLLELKFSVDQVIRDYGDLYQAITDLAVEKDAPFGVAEFCTLNRCLDNAISDAVTEFSYQKEQVRTQELTAESSRRVSDYFDDFRELLGTASLAFGAAKAGNLSLCGATGSILERSLNSLKRLIDEAVENAPTQNSDLATLAGFSLSTLINEIAGTSAQYGPLHDSTLNIGPVDCSLALHGNRELLAATISYMVLNAFKFTKPGTEVLLTAYAAADRILIDVKDQCGGLAPGVEESLFDPCSQHTGHKFGTGLGMAVAMQSVNANAGMLTVRDVPGTGCIFTISLPRHQLPN